MKVYGPGPTRSLPPSRPIFPPGNRIPLVNPANPTPGLAALTRAEIEAHAYDLNSRMREAVRAGLTALVEPHEIVVPSALRAGPR